MLFLLSKIAPSDATIVSVDLPGKQGGYPEWRKKIYHKFSSRGQLLNLIKADSHKEETLLEVKKIIGERDVDLLFIDGDHTYEGARHDFLMYKGLVRNGGMIVFHDIAQHSPESGCEVDRLWREAQTKSAGGELIRDKNQGWGGIGILYVEQ